MKKVGILSIVSLIVLAIVSSIWISIPKAGAAPAHHTQTQLQYVALGDSLAFGYQPNGDFTHGYANDLFQTLQLKKNYAGFVNLACVGESTTTFINGDPSHLNPVRGCLVPQVQTSTQFSQALAYLNLNASKIGLVTLDIGINDFLGTGAINTTNCAVDPSIFNAQLAVVDHNLATTILPQLKQALRAAHNQRAHVSLVGYYNPLQQLCPNTIPYVKMLNAHLRHDAQGLAAFVDTYSLFPANSLCQLTWICHNLPAAGDIHATNEGYALIAGKIYQHVFGA